MDKKEKKRQLLLKYGEVGICPSCQDFMVWKEKEHSFSFQGETLSIKKYPFLICENTSCYAIGTNNKELEYIKGRAKRRYLLTGVKVSDYLFLKKYVD